MRLINLILLIGICLSFISVCSCQKPINTDHHVHLFSEDLIKELKAMPMLKRSFERSIGSYTNIDTILHLSNAKQIWLISTGYAYKPKQCLRKEIALQLIEQHHLHNAAKKHKNKVIPFYGINPLKSYALQLVKRAHRNLNFNGIKMHFQTSHIDFRKEEHINKLREIFTYTGRFEIPVILHFHNHKRGLSKSEIDFFFDSILPDGYAHQLIFAHFGGAGLLKSADLQNAEYIKQASIKKSMVKLKFDLSGIVLPEIKNNQMPPYNEIAHSIRNIGMEYFLFGSDYPLKTSIQYRSTIEQLVPLRTKEWKRIIKNTF